jgi:hypothetical protein
VPEYSCILGPTDDLVTHMIAEPLMLEHLFDLGGEVDSFVLPAKGLLVVRVPEHWWANGGEVRQLGPGVLQIGREKDPRESPWLHVPCDTRPWFMGHEELRERFRWFSDVAPPCGLVSWLNAAAKATGEPLAYFHHMERGDDLYYEFALLFSGVLEPSLMITQTYLVDTDDDEQCVLFAPSGRSAFVGSVFATVLEHIGSPSRIQYFPPEDDPRFKWEVCRVDPGDYRSS